MLANAKILEAIALKKCLSATYNRMHVILAPHVLYKKNDSHYIDAVTLERDGQEPRELKLGAFNLDGLKDVTLTDRTFEPSSLYVPYEERYRDATLFSIES
jgi:hypothetical protein